MIIIISDWLPGHTRNAGFSAAFEITVHPGLNPSIVREAEIRWAGHTNLTPPRLATASLLSDGTIRIDPTNEHSEITPAMRKALTEAVTNPPSNP